MADLPLPVTLKASLEGQKAEYRQVGKSGLRVSVPILGAMGFGDQKWLNWVIDEDEVSICFDPHNTYPHANRSVGIANPQSSLR